MKFSEFNLHPDVLAALEKIGYEEPTPIQQKTLPLILERKDVIGLAETGSGKTAACAIPISHLVSEEEKHIQALIVVPTRELALQYAVELQKIGIKKRVKAFALYGGEDYDIQRAKLKSGVHVLIATPGRLIDFIYARELDLSKVETLILDEADQMLGLGFLDDLEFIIQCLVHEHQTLLFSATMSADIEKIAGAYMRDPEKVFLISDKPSPKQIDHLFTFVKNPHFRLAALQNLLGELKPNQAIIFCNSRHEVEKVAAGLKAKNPFVDFLHGGLSQDIRTIITGKFRRGKIHYLVATDVAARGLDFAGVTHIFNFHLPHEIETYVHRSGRTGRVGRKGVCVSLCTARDLKFVGEIKKTIQKEIEWIGPPPRNL